jgi:hypothetical protein
LKYEVRFGSLADMKLVSREVSFTPKSGHATPHRLMSAKCQ